jgi:hypothetical protein
MDANRYYRPLLAKAGVPETHAFRSWYGWGDDGALLEAGGRHYMLSTALAMTSGVGGNSLAEVVAYLDRSASADGMLPAGTIYLQRNDDIRSKARQTEYGPTILGLDALGVRGEAVVGELPIRRGDVQGVVAGVAKFDWPGSGSQIQPGAICENLTSYGGALENTGQTPLTAWLRGGAAGSSGTVVEPFLITAKFPAPEIHLHYARGCSLAEAYYQSVACPFQLLIVGDPLCQPWVHRPAVKIRGLEPGAVVRGGISLSADVTSAKDRPADRVEWYLDGRKLATSFPPHEVELSSEGMADGYHELRVVAVQATDVETQALSITPFQVERLDHRVELSAAKGKVQWGTPLAVTVKTDAVSAIVCQGQRVLGRVKGPEGSLAFDPQLLGLGPIELQAFAISVDNATLAVSQPLMISIEPGPKLAGYKLPPQIIVLPGFTLAAGAEPSKTITKVDGDSWLAAEGVKPGTHFSITGVITALEDDVYQFQVRHSGSLNIDIGERQLYVAQQGDGSVRLLPIGLERGLHRVRISGTAGDPVKLDLKFGHRGVSDLDGKLLEHLAGPGI